MLPSTFWLIEPTEETRKKLLEQILALPAGPQKDFFMEFLIKTEFIKNNKVVGSSYTALNKHGEPPNILVHNEETYCLEHFYRDKAKYILQQDGEDDIPF